MQKGTLIYYDTCTQLFLANVNLRTVEYACSAMYLGRIYRHEQSDIAYQGFKCSANSGKTRCKDSYHRQVINAAPLPVLLFSAQQSSI